MACVCHLRSATTPYSSYKEMETQAARSQLACDQTTITSEALTPSFISFPSSHSLLSSVSQIYTNSSSKAAIISYIHLDAQKQ